MIEPMTLTDLAVQHGGVLLHPDCQFERVSTDTRTIGTGELFVALRGPNFDANELIEQAVRAGAGGVLVERVNRDVNLPQLVVENSLTALTQLASMNRDEFAGKLVAITGSSGKTTVKEMVRAILQLKAETLATRGNLNNHIGVPLTLLELNDAHRFAVIEMGASGPGEIAPLSSLARPDVAMVNNVAPAHIEGFGSIENVRVTKGGIYDGLGEDGTAVVNLDSERTRSYLQRLENRKVITFSMDPESGADLHASNIRVGVLDVCFTLHCQGKTEEVELPAMGRHNVSNALAAAACARGVGISLRDIALGLRLYKGASGRLTQCRTREGALLIDDSYNANPDSMATAIDVLARCEGKRILVVGDMAELGADAPEMHAEVGHKAKLAEIDNLLAVGQLSRSTVREFGEGGQHYDTQEQLIEALGELVNEGASILVKGSRSSRMDRVVSALAAEEGV